MNVDGLSTLHTLANVLGIAPTLNYNEPYKKRLLSDVFRGVIFIAFFVSIFAYSSYGKAFVFGQFIHRAVLWTYTLSELLVTFINVFGIWILNLRYGHRLQAFLRRLQHLERFMISKEGIPKATRRLQIELGTMTTLGLIFGCLTGYVYWTNLGWDVYKYFALREFENSSVIVLMDMITRYPKLIELRMKELNEHLHSTVELGQVVWASSTGDVKSSKHGHSIKTLSQAYTTIVELIEEYNDLIGPLCLVFCGNIVVNILVPINMSLLFLHGGMIHSGQTFGTSFIVLCAFWVIFPCVYGLKLFAVCDKAEKEVRKVPYICYSLMQALGDDEFKLKNELDQYANQADRMKPKFSAAGFFDINFGLTLPVFGSVFTYMIVLMQFHNM